MAGTQTIDLDIHLPWIIAGESRAFGAWLAGAEPHVRDSLRSFARAIDVEAVLQETLLRVWQVAPRFIPDGRANGLLRLAIRIGLNLAVSEVRRTRATPVDGDDLEAALAAAEAPVAVANADHDMDMTYIASAPEGWKSRERPLQI